MYKICIKHGKMAEINNTSKTYTITKRIAKHGNQAIIVIPRLLESQLKPGTIVKLNIDVLESLEKDE